NRLHYVLSFFLSSRRRHTRSKRDWSSDVCSSDLGEYRSTAAKILRHKIQGNNSFVDDKKVSDHHAIIPTENHVHPSDFSERERRIYDLIVKRFLAVLLPAHEYEQTTVTSSMGAESSTARGKTVKKNGWKEAYANKFDDR